MIVNADGKKINSYKKTVDARKEADSIIFSIEKDLQELKEYPSDIDEYQVLSLISGECDYDIMVKKLKYKGGTLWQKKLKKITKSSLKLRKN